MDRLHLTELDILHKLTHVITIRGNWGNGRLVDLLLQSIDTLTLKDSGIAISKETIGKIHDILLRKLRHTVEKTSLL